MHIKALTSTLTVQVLLAVPICAFAAGSANTCSPQTFGGHPGQLDTSAIQQAIDHCNASGGGKVVLSKGVWISGPLALRSNVTLKIEKNAVLKSKKSRAGFVAAFIDYPAKAGEALILANGAHNVGIVGKGIIMGNGLQWWGEAEKVRDLSDTQFEKKYPGMPPTNGMPRPWLVEFNNVSGGVVRGVHLWSSPMWTLVIRSSKDVSIRGITVRNPRHTPNTDGIDIVSSSDVSVTGSTISTGDDDVVIKSGLKQGILAASNNIRIENDVMLNGGGVAIGSETANGIHNVRVSHVKFFGTSHGIRVKSARDRGNRIGPETISDITMRNVKYPLLINERFGEHFGTSAGKPLPALKRKPITRTTPYISGVSISHMDIDRAGIAMILSGLPESPVKDVSLKDVHINAQYGALMRYVSAAFQNVTIHVKHGKRILPGPDTKLKMAPGSR